SHTVASRRKALPVRRLVRTAARLRACRRFPGASARLRRNPPWKSPWAMPQDSAKRLRSNGALNNASVAPATAHGMISSVTNSRRSVSWSARKASGRLRSTRGAWAATYSHSRRYSPGRDPSRLSWIKFLEDRDDRLGVGPVDLKESVAGDE